MVKVLKLKGGCRSTAFELCPLGGELYLTDGYFRWLVDQVDGENNENLLYVLSTIDYEWTIPKDSARSDCGVDLRRTYLDEKGLSSDNWPAEGPCTILEMLISLTYKGFHEILYEPGNSIHDGAANLFWEVLYNINIDKEEYTDDASCWQADSIEFTERLIKRKMRKIMRHTYERNGRGSLFPLNVNSRNIDMRKECLYMQMQLYISEKYF